ncbi:UDP-N-acetylglucosamine 2-epimerase [Streptomyces sp. NPDC002589]|uniref:UDP-N-acetylglucosamine 2-epimerase n=1 Tax=Streptomyces sp. NPDC002589 TaxID=3154420 RepID=UPI003321B5FD
MPAPSASRFRSPIPPPLQRSSAVGGPQDPRAYPHTSAMPHLRTPGHRTPVRVGPGRGAAGPGQRRTPGRPCAPGSCTERIEGLESGSAVLAGTDTRRIVKEATALLSAPDGQRVRCPYGDGHAAERAAACVRFLETAL